MRYLTIASVIALFSGLYGGPANAACANLTIASASGVTSQKYMCQGADGVWRLPTKNEGAAVYAPTSPPLPSESNTVKEAPTKSAQRFEKNNINNFSEKEIIELSRKTINHFYQVVVYTPAIFSQKIRDPNFNPSVDVEVFKRALKSTEETIIAGVAGDDFDGAEVLIYMQSPFKKNYNYDGDLLETSLDLSRESKEIGYLSESQNKLMDLALLEIIKGSMRKVSKDPSSKFNPTLIRIQVDLVKSIRDSEEHVGLRDAGFDKLLQRWISVTEPSY